MDRHLPQIRIKHIKFFQIFRVFLPTGRQAKNSVKLLHLPVCTNQFQLSETHYRLGFASRPSISHYQFRPVKDWPVALIFSGWPFTDFSSVNYWKDWTELKLVRRRRRRRFRIDRGGPLRGSSSPLRHFEPARVKPNLASTLVPVGRMTGSVNSQRL